MQFITVAGLIMISLSILGFIFNAVRKQREQGVFIGGKGGDFENAVLDQIRNGIYLLNIEEERSSRGAQAITEREARTIQQDQTVQVRVRIRRDNAGMEMRKDAQDHPLKKFGLVLVQANVQEVDPDPAFKDKLKEQREAAAQVAIERQNARKEEERKKRIIAQGEAEKAEKKIELEKQQIERVIAGETKAKEAEQDQVKKVTEATTRKREAEIEYERKQIELETARLEAERIQTLAQAESDRRRMQWRRTTPCRSGSRPMCRSPRLSPRRSGTSAWCRRWWSAAVRAATAPTPRT